MARVLCAWEFGSDLGHIRRLMPIARELRALGHSVSVAFRHSTQLDVAAAEGFEAFLAPLLRVPPRVSASPLNYSDILLNLGFDDRPGLSGALRAWRSLLALVEPDIVVADYAPGALIAARAAGIPRVTVGTGFSVPPAQDPLPALRPWATTDPGVLRALDDRVLNAVRASLDPAAKDVPQSASDMFAAQAHLLCTFPEMDPFAPRGNVEYVGPQGDSTTGAEVRWQGGAARRVFAYLKPRNERFRQTLDGLRALDAEAIVAAPGMDASDARAASGGNLRVVPGAVSLDPLLADANLCVSHAGPGLAARALVAGVPMALLPLQLEQFLIANRISKGGSAAVTSPEDPAPDYRAWFTQIMDRDDMREAARGHAERHRGYSFEEATRRAAARVAEVAGAR